MTDTNILFNILITSKIKEVSEEQIVATIKELRAKGISYHRIAKETGIPKTTAYSKINARKPLKQGLTIEKIEIFIDDFIPVGEEIDTCKRIIIKLKELVNI